MLAQRVDVGGNDVGLHLVDCGALDRPRMVDRVDHAQQLPGALVLTEFGKGHRRPHRSVRVLPAVLTNAGDVAADVAWVQVRLVEWRIEELDEPVLAAHQPFVDGLHGLARARELTRPATRVGEYGPALRDRIDPAFAVACRTEHRAIVEPRTTVPPAIPAMLLDVATQPAPFSAAEFSENRIAMRSRHRGELPEHFAQEEAQPDAFSLSLHADQIHAIVPVAAPHQRQAMLAELQAAPDGAHAVFVETRRAGRAAGQIVVGVVFRVDRTAFKKVHRFIEHAGIAAARDVAAHRQR
ncbi:MAG: hypothetical protein AW07_03753 [Candidatus Accumulibacter sp. SK-11]|nr:MAG: hypothetical protein AW07_03753 [Candidatus Accumulibacter sp. SK-11]